MTPEQIEQVLGEHEARWTTHGNVIHCESECDWSLRQKAPMSDEDCYQAHRAHVAQVLASLMPTATETVEYKPSKDARDSWITTTPWAKRDLRAGEVCLRRTVTTYAPLVGEWEEADS